MFGIQSLVNEVRNAISSLPDGPLKQAAMQALQNGSVIGEIFKWPK